MTPTRPDLLILGQNGQLARALFDVAKSKAINAVAAGRRSVDLTRQGAAQQLIGSLQPSMVINAAAYTAVDQAESDEKTAFALNASAAADAAAAAAQHGARFVQVSTDYVFGGAGTGPYSEQDEAAPLNVYGRSKLAGEIAVLERDRRAVVVRTSGVFSGEGSDFPSAMWRLAASRDSIDVVDDQLTTPIYVGDLAERLLTLAQAPGASGLYHCGGAPGVSWAEFAETAMAIAAKRGLPSAQINRVSSQAFKRAAMRPSDSRLSSTRLESETGHAPAEWRTGLERALDAWIGNR